MKKRLFLFSALLLLIVSLLSSCALFPFPYEDDSDLSSSTKDEKTESNTNSSADEEYREDYISISKLSFGKGATIDSFVDYFESRLDDDSFPRVRKYYANSLDSYDEDLCILQTCNATYCYKYYDGRQKANGDIVYLREVYFVPEVELFYVQNTTYVYDNLASINYTYKRTASFAFKLGQKATTPLYGGTYHHQAYNTYSNDLAYYELSYTYDLPHMVVPSNLPLLEDVAIEYYFGDATNLSQAKEHADIVGEAEKIYSCLQGAFNFCQQCFREVDASYNLLSK